ncbi:MAG: hypothetical protein KGL67_02230 [Patescibacteria group bacterium]|nr:hypothetical protein [Patescibacteria group bacterium]
MPKKPLKTKLENKVKICSRCGLENNLRNTDCEKCKSSRFEPDWVLAKSVVNRQTSVQITTTNPEYGEVQKRITLSKWWPGGRATFHITKPGQWETVKNIIDEKLTPILGWKSAEKIIKNISKKGISSAEKKKEINNLVISHPELLKEIVTHIDSKKLSAEDFDSLTETLGQISDVVTNANAGFREAFLSVIKKLPSQPQRALEDLDLLLKGWNLNVITNVAQQVRTRLETINLFEERINDPRTLEIKGDNSIHRILERAMWLIDERYWLLHSNATLRKTIGDQLEKHNKKLHGKKRPDFVCGTVGERLVILELKRPSHELTTDDLNQLETYIAIAEKHFKFSTFSAYLVGKSVSADLKQRLRYRSGSFSVLYYSNIIDDTKTRYDEFLKTIEKERV